MDFIDTIANYLYADGDLLLTACRVIAYVFALEALAYLVSVIMGVTKTACK